MRCTVNIKAQSPATPVPLIAKNSVQALDTVDGALKKEEAWEGWSAVPPCAHKHDTEILRHCHTITPLGHPVPRQSAISGVAQRKRPRGREGRKSPARTFPLSPAASSSSLCTYSVVTPAPFQFGIAGEWLTCRPCGEGQALAPIKLTCLWYRVLCFLTMQCLMSCAII